MIEEMVALETPYKTDPVDILDEFGNWVGTFRFEPFLNSWYFVDPDLPAKVRLFPNEKIPETVLNSAKVDKTVTISGAYQSPVKLQIQLNRYCNYSCPMCYALSDKAVKRPEDHSLEQLVKLFKDAKEAGILRVNFVGGEVFMRKDFPDIVDAAIEERLLVSCITNARIPGGKIEKYKDLLAKMWNVQVSCNGIGESYEREYGISGWSSAKDAIGEVISSTRANILSFVVTKDNVEDILGFFDFASCVAPTIVKFGTVCWSGRSANEGATSYYSEILPRARALIAMGRDKYPNLQVQSQIDWGYETPIWESFANDYRPFEFYFAPEARDGLYVSSSGDVFPFPLLSDQEEFNLGNVRRQKLLDIWRSSRLLERIRAVSFKDSECGRIGCKAPCGLWSRSYAISWSGRLDGKVPCELTNWK